MNADAGAPRSFPWDHVRATIDALCIDAKVLLLRAQHEGMKVYIRGVQRDLAEVLALLDERAPEAVPEVVEAAVKSASSRLQRVESGLRTNPNISDFS